MRYALLDPLRGLAAVWVFLFHYEFSAPFRAGAPFLHAVFKQGYLGVPMFFVISGFCLAASARSAAARGEATRTFLARRFRRIYPPFWCSMVVVASVPFAVEGVSRLKTGVYQRPASAGNPALGYLDFTPFDWLRVATLTKVFDPPGEGPGLESKFNRLNAVYWTLAVEVQFYVVVALALSFRRRFYAVIAATTAASVPFFLDPASYRTGLFLPYWPMFAVGVGLFAVLEAGFTPAKVFGAARLAVAAAATAGAVAAYLLVVRSGIAPTSFQTAAFFGLALWLGQGLDGPYEALAASPRVAVRVPLTVWGGVGLMSYSVYLLHAKLYPLVAQFARQFIPPGTAALDFAVLAGTVALCYPFYLGCEAPFFRPRARRPPDPAAAAAP